ncbi:MAG: phytoene/squalene synthase family protein [Bryobacteraceae bacterium]|nr:phytoene/squalene synthase family protein [Bryobacteraceae bacterium]
MRTAAELGDLYREAAEQTARGSKSFYFATRFFPADLARSAHAVYWFCRHTDDLVDEAPSVEQGRAEIEAWSELVEVMLGGGDVEHPVLRLFREAMDRHGIPAEYPRELIEGMRMDLERVRYATFADLRVFCYRVASVVGLMMSHVIGFRGPALPYAIDLGIAMQLTNILRDVGEDLAMDRIYLPQDEMTRFGYSEEDLRAKRRNAAFDELMGYQVKRARDYYRRAEPGIALLRPEGRFAVKVAADVYREILGRIEGSGFDVFDRRAVVPGYRKYWLTARSMAGPMARQSFERLAWWKAQA